MPQMCQQPSCHASLGRCQMPARLRRCSRTFRKPSAKEFSKKRCPSALSTAPALRAICARWAKRLRRWEIRKFATVGWMPKVVSPVPRRNCSFLSGIAPYTLWRSLAPLAVKSVKFSPLMKRKFASTSTLPKV